MPKVTYDKIGKEPYIIGVINEVNAMNVYLANKLAIDGVTGYALLPNLKGAVVQKYKDLIPERVAEWHNLQKGIKIPFFPVVVAGWDASVRGEEISQLSEDISFPWVPIVTEVTPELFGSFIDLAIEFNLQYHPDKNIIYIWAWNEWTEIFLLLSQVKRFGTQFLE